MMYARHHDERIEDINEIEANVETSNCILGLFKNRVQPAYYNKGKNHIPILMLLEQTPQHIIAYIPDE